MPLEEPPESLRRSSEPETPQGQQPRRIGIFGGTFDPPHIGHLIVGETVRDALDLDEMRFVVANNPWQKTSDRVITEAEIRLEMVQLALGDAQGLVASDVEIELGGPSYSIVTLEYMRHAEPNAEWLLVVGADAAAGLDTWHRAAELAAMVEVVVVNRPGETGSGVPPDGWRWTAVEVPSIGVSSTEVRSRVAEGRSIRFLTPEPVAVIIGDAELYRHR